MKRIRRTTGSILEELRGSGYTNKEIYTKLGIPERTFYNYKRYFDARLINKNSRKPPEEIENKIREYARNRGIRSSYDLPSSQDVLGLVKIAYKYVFDDKEDAQIRNMNVELTLSEWRDLSDKEGFAEDHIAEQFSRANSAFVSLEVIDVQFVLERDL